MTDRVVERRVLVLALLGPAVGPELAEAARRVADWDFVVTRARRSLVWPGVAVALRDCGALAQLPAAVRESARDAIAHTTAQNAALLRDLAAAAGALEARAIPALALKGAALLAAHGAAPRLRYQLDVDLLVRRADLAAALDALRERGFALPAAVGHDGAAVDPLATAARDHAAPALLAPLGTPVELHWRLPGDRASDDALSRLLPRARRAEVAGRRVALPEPDALFAQLCVHVVWHHAASPQYLARHLADAALLLDGGAVDRAQLLRARGTPRAARAAIALTLALLDRARDARRRDRVAVLLFPEGRTEAAQLRLAHAADVARVAVETARAGPRAAWQRVFPARAYLDALYGPAAAGRSYAALLARRLIEHATGARRGRGGGDQAR